MKVVIVEPNEPAYVTEIDSGLKSMQDVVGGLIEPMNFYDDCVLVGNEEAKLIGLEGNRRIGESIIAGTFFICGEELGEDGYEFCSLSDELIDKYLDHFSEPELIEQEEVQADMGYSITFW